MSCAQHPPPRQGLFFQLDAALDSRQPSHSLHGRCSCAARLRQKHARRPGSAQGEHTVLAIGSAPALHPGTGKRITADSPAIRRTWERFQIRPFTHCPDSQSLPCSISHAAHLYLYLAVNLPIHRFCSQWPTWAARRAHAVACVPSLPRRICQLYLSSSGTGTLLTLLRILPAILWQSGEQNQAPACTRRRG